LRGILDLRHGVNLIRENSLTRMAGSELGSKKNEEPPIFKHDLRFGDRKIFGSRGKRWKI
jgi:hypothetical protein